MPSRMYSTIQLLEIMRRSAFKSPLSYPFLLGLMCILAYKPIVQTLLPELKVYDGR
jgi:hypothetical protein